MTKVKDLFLDMKTEVKRIRWCKGKELLKNVIVTIFTIVFFALFFMAIQYLITLVKMIDFKSIINSIRDLF